MPNHDSVGQILRQLRHESGFSLRELAGCVGVSFPHLSKIESGKEVPSEQLLILLASQLKTDPDDLLMAAQRVPPDLADAVLSKSTSGSAEFLRTWRDGGISDKQVEDLLRSARRRAN